MNSDENSWRFNLTEASKEDVDPLMYNLEINCVHYVVSHETAAITHAILLLVDAVRDKRF